MAAAKKKASTKKVAKKKAAKKAAPKRAASKKAAPKRAKKAAGKKAAPKRATPKRVKAKKASPKRATPKRVASKRARAKDDAVEGSNGLSPAERRRALRRRRRTLRMQKASGRLTSVQVAGSASKSMALTRTRIVRKREEIGVLPIDKNVMIKELIKAGSVERLAQHFGTTKQAIGGWFGRRGLAVQDITDEGGDRKKEIL